MKYALVGTIAVALSACSGQTERTYTVDEADEALLSKVMKECRNNPGELREAPNCRNADAADWKLRLERMRKSLGG
ncbi:MAG: EexN family lipoprotein [Rhizobium giardinii]